ncbi:related to S.fumigata Asp FII [Rhynchosporium graminicola]|uniref:Related to S.fumigata Asp FII n=1 Tax=Rhynchosporium graminicola TaxID=2792576 RepID=A0A1E1L1Z6_9HELO|nr:related to S.fumigata Asp FII [Rhynchosporium commune]
MLFSSALLLGGLSLTTAIPTFSSEQDVEKRDGAAWTWNEGAVTDYTIHVSCNATERAQLQRAFNESLTLAQHAKDHILRWGNSSETYVKYFGNSSTTAEPAGWFDKLINGDKTGVLFRCDDIDNKCYQDGWAGHWREEKAPDQTVICPLSFEARWPLEAMCGHGYTVAEKKDSLYFGADLLHRLYHTHKVAEGVVDHYADTQEDIIALAKEHPEQAVRNSATLRHFAVEVYAYDIAVPGIGCPGSLPPASGTPTTPEAPHGAPAATPSAPASSDAPPPSTTAPEPVSTTSSAAAECHTHADGVVHCA